MRRICVSALLLGALSLPAWADPLAITPDEINTAAAPDASEQTVPLAAPARVAAAQPDLGGGFIQFLFGGAAPPVSAPPVAQTSPGDVASAPAPLATALASDPDAAAAANGDDGHPPVDQKYDRQIVDYGTKEAPGTIIIDTPHKFLYLVEDGGKAMRYGIGVGRQGFTWSGTETISRKAEWPDWYPPAEMIARQPYLPRFVAGGPQNPLGARALYLGHSEYRIHGTNDPSTIGHRVSSGCIRLTNEDVIDLFGRVGVGTKVVVLPQTARNARSTHADARPAAAPAVRTADGRQTMIIPVAAAPAQARARPMSIVPSGLY
jgi:lipoprotein-anchoring transpeptidase ErfK/SrfK